MPIKFSGYPVLYTLLRADTSAHLRADLDAAVLAAGWTVDSTLVNGKVYLMTSPQGLQAKCRIQDTGRAVFLGPHVIDVQFNDVAGTSPGFQHDLPYGGGWISANKYTAQIGICQIFIKAAGQTSESHDGTRVYNVAGGIPWYPIPLEEPCQVGEHVPPTILWWTGGGCETNRGNQANFRTSRFQYAAYSVNVNGGLYVAPGDSVTHATVDSYELGPLQILTQTATYNVDFWYYVPPKTLVYQPPGTTPERPLNVEPLLMFRYNMIGQLWDAFCKTAPTALDEVITTVEKDQFGNDYDVTWEAYNYDIPDELKGGGGTWYSTLYLLKGFDFDPYDPDGGGPAGGGASNYAY